MVPDQSLRNDLEELDSFGILEWKGPLTGIIFTIERSGSQRQHFSLFMPGIEYPVDLNFAAHIHITEVEKYLLGRDKLEASRRTE